MDWLLISKVYKFIKLNDKRPATTGLLFWANTIDNSHFISYYKDNLISHRPPAHK